MTTKDLDNVKEFTVDVLMNIEDPRIILDWDNEEKREEMRNFITHEYRDNNCDITYTMNDDKTINIVTLVELICLPKHLIGEPWYRADFIPTREWYENTESNEEEEIKNNLYEWMEKEEIEEILTVFDWYNEEIEYNKELKNKVEEYHHMFHLVQYLDEEDLVDVLM